MDARLRPLITDCYLKRRRRRMMMMMMIIVEYSIIVLIYKFVAMPRTGL